MAGLTKTQLVRQMAEKNGVTNKQAAAFLESLAHDTGSVRGALGMQVVCERQGRTEEATRFHEVAQRCWRKADPGRLETELAAMRVDFTTRPTGLDPR